MTMKQKNVPYQQQYELYCHLKLPLWKILKYVFVVSVVVFVVVGSSCSHDDATIAEIATRTYYVSNPPKALPDAIINTAVMDAMIERWPTHWSMTFPPSEFKTFNNLDALSTEEIEAMLRQRAIVAEDATNAQRLRHVRALVMLNEEMDRRFKAHEQSQERGGPGRSR